MKTYQDTELLYTATARCRCGAGLAYPMNHDKAMKIAAWVCSKMLRGEGTPPDPAEHDALPWNMYKVREETSINNTGAHSTRPAGTVVKTVGKATCPKCKRTWESQPYEAMKEGHHWFPGDCPGCGYGVGGHGSHSTKDGPSIDTRYRDVVLVTVPEVSPNLTR